MERRLSCGKKPIDKDGIIPASIVADFMEIILTLLERLKALAAEWERQSGRSKARLATIVVNDGGFFVRIDQPKASCTVATFERFVGFFRDPANWPSGPVPELVNQLLDGVDLRGGDISHNADVTTVAAETSPGKTDEIFPSGDAQERAA